MRFLCFLSPQLIGEIGPTCYLLFNLVAGVPSPPSYFWASVIIISFHIPHFSSISPFICSVVCTRYWLLSRFGIFPAWTTFFFFLLPVLLRRFLTGVGLPHPTRQFGRFYCLLGSTFSGFHKALELTFVFLRMLFLYRKYGTLKGQSTYRLKAQNNLRCRSF